MLVGGASTDHTVWDRLVPLLADRHTGYALDRRGRGASGDRPGSTVDDEIADVVAATAATGGDAILVGHSSGALLALRAAARRPDLVRVVVGYEPPALPPGATPASARLRKLIDAGDRDGAQWLFRTATVGLPPAAVRALRATPQWQHDLALAHTLPYDAAIVEEGLPETTLPVPATLLLGTGSAAPMADGVHRYAAALSADVRMLDGQQHFAMITAPALLAAAITGAAESPGACGTASPDCAPRTGR